MVIGLFFQKYQIQITYTCTWNRWKWLHNKGIRTIILTQNYLRIIYTDKHLRPTVLSNLPHKTVICNQIDVNPRDICPHNIHSQAANEWIHVLIGHLQYINPMKFSKPWKYMLYTKIKVNDRWIQVRYSCKNQHHAFSKCIVTSSLATELILKVDTATNY